jgi:DNA-binding NtrC family response regulator
MDTSEYNANETDDGENFILVVDDEEHFLSSITFILAQLGYSNVHTCSDSILVMDILRTHSCSAVLLDISMPRMTGIDLLDMIHEEFPEIPVIMITAIVEIKTAVECIKRGAFNYLLKPLEIERLESTLKNAIDFADSQKENFRLRERMLSRSINIPDTFKNIITQDSNLLSIFSYIEAVASSRQPILITGETGTGKELIAHAIHNASGRTGRFVPVNIGGLSETFIEDELFGHQRGAFTGAVNDRAGMIDKAANGTLFLDEIGDLSLPLQVKFLRLIQERNYQPLGSDESAVMSARIVVATNQLIKDLVQKGTFRRDLYYRLSTHQIHLPPLRERMEDIPLLLDAFITQSATELGKKIPIVPAQLYTLLATYNFPGNIREFQSMVFDAMSQHTSGTLSMSVFQGKIKSGRGIGNAGSFTEILHTEKAKIIIDGTLPTLKEMQELLIDEALKMAGGNQTIAASLLGMSRRGLNGRLAKRTSEN